MALNAPTALSIAGRPNPLNERKRAVLSDVSTQIMDLANDPNPGTAPQSLQSAREIGDSAIQAGVIPVTALPAMNQFLQSIKTKRAAQGEVEEEEEQELVPRGLPRTEANRLLFNKPSQPSGLSRTVELGPRPGSTKVEGPAQLEQFVLPAGTLREGERLAGKVITSDGSFAKGLIESAAHVTPGKKLSPDQVRARSARLRVLKVKEKTIEEFQAANAPSQSDRIMAVIDKFQPGREPGTLFNTKTRANLLSFMEPAAINVLEKEAIKQEDVRIAVQKKIEIDEAIRAGHGKAFVDRGKLKGFVNPVTLKETGSISNDDLDAALANKSLVSVNTAELVGIRKAAPALQTLLQLKKLAFDNPDVFPRVSELGQAGAFLQVQKNKLKQLAGVASVNPVFAKLQSFKIALVPLIKAFGDTGNISVKEADRAIEAIGLESTSFESLSSILDAVFRTLEAGIIDKGLNPKFLQDAREALKVIPDEKVGGFSINRGGTI